MTNYQNKIVKESKIVNFSNYNKLFDELIIKRGDKLFKDDKIKQLKISNHKYSCTIEGTQVYSLFIEFDEYDNINNMECSCPYYEKGNNCKHLYALLIEAKLKDNYNKLIILKNKRLDEFKNQFKIYKNYLIKNLNKYSEYNQEIINLFINCYEKEQIPKYEKVNNYEMDQNTFLEIITEIEYSIKLMENLFREIKLKEKKIIEENQSKGLLSSILFGVIAGLNSPSPEKTKEDSIMKMAIEELEKGNSEPYIIEYNELDDDMFQDYE